MFHGKRCQCRICLKQEQGRPEQGGPVNNTQVGSEDSAFCLVFRNLELETCGRPAETTYAAIGIDTLLEYVSSGLGLASGHLMDIIHNC